MRLLLLILVAGAVTGGAHAQFRGANSQRTRFDSDEFDNDFDDLFDRRSRERNSIERDSFERFTFGRTNNNNNNLVFRDSIERDSFEIRRPISNNRNANTNNFVLVRDSPERDSFEARRLFGTTQNTNNRRVNNNNFRSQGFRRDSPETNSIEIQVPLTNAQLSNLNQNLAAPGFRRGSFESVEIRNPFLSAQRSNTNRNTNFGFRRDSDERDNSIEVRIPVNNLRTVAPNLPAGITAFRTVSLETDSFEIGSPFGSRRQRPSVSTVPRPAARRPGAFFRDSIEDDSLEIRLTNPFLNAAARSRQQPNRNTGVAARPPVSNFGGRGSVLRFDSFERNSLERDSLEDLVEDLTDDDADDRARARLALQRLGRLPGGSTITPSRSSGSANTNPFGRPLSATGSGTNNPFGRPVTLTNNRAITPARNTITNSNVFGRPLNANNNNAVDHFGRPLSINNNRNVLNQEVTDQLNALIAANRITTTSNTFSNTNNNRNFGRLLPTLNTNRASTSGTNNQRSTGALFPPLPSLTQGLRTNSRINSNTIASTGSNFNNANNNRFNLNDNRFNLNNNPFLSRTSSNQNQNQPPRTQVTTTTTTPRPFRPVTPLPTPSRRPSTTRRPTPPPTTRRPAPIPTTTARPTPQPPRRTSSFGSGTANPFQTAARLNNIVRSESDKPPANPFINPSISRESKKSSTSSSSSSSSSSRNKLGSGPRKSIPAVVPMGFEWPGGNGYYFRMSTGNSKPIQYFISYDD